MEPISLMGKADSETMAANAVSALAVQTRVFCPSWLDISRTCSHHPWYYFISVNFPRFTSHKYTEKLNGNPLSFLVVTTGSLSLFLSGMPYIKRGRK